MMSRKKYLFSLVLFVGIACAVLFALGERPRRELSASDTPYLNPGLTLDTGSVGTGIHIDEYLKGKRVFTLKTDSVGVRGKKAKFLRLGFWKVAEMENVTLDFYYYTSVSEGHRSGDLLSSSEGLVKAWDGYGDITRLFTKNDELRRLFPGNVKGVEIEGMTVRMYENGELESSLSSYRANLGAEGEEFVFDGDVQLASRNGRTLSCGKLFWVSDERKFKTTGPYVLRDNERMISGQGIETDYGLEEMTFSGRGA